MRKSLSEILPQHDLQSLAQTWQTTEAADDYGPLPAGEYLARILSGELFNSRTNGTPGYKLKFQIVEGEYAERQFWHDLWLTPAAMAMTKRELAKIGINTIQQLDEPVPPGIRCRVKLTLRREDDGTEHNRVSRMEFVGLDEAAQPDAFAPNPSNRNGGA